MLSKDATLAIYQIVKDQLVAEATYLGTFSQARPTTCQWTEADKAANPSWTWIALPASGHSRWQNAPMSDAPSVRIGKYNGPSESRQLPGKIDSTPVQLADKA
jgi:hypothetical protein